MPVTFILALIAVAVITLYVLLPQIWRAFTGRDPFRALSDDDWNVRR